MQKENGEGFWTVHDGFEGGMLLKAQVLELSVSLPVRPLLILSSTRVDISLIQDHHLAGCISKMRSSRKKNVHVLLTLVLCSFVVVYLASLNKCSHGFWSFLENL